MTSHAHNQASVWKTLDELPASAFIFGSRNAWSEFSWFDCVHRMSENVPACIARTRGLTEMRMGFQSGLAKRRRLGDEMMGMHLSSVCAVPGKTNWFLNGVALHESE